MTILDVHRLMADTKSILGLPSGGILREVIELRYRVNPADYIGYCGRGRFDYRLLFAYYIDPHGGGWVLNLSVCLICILS